MRRTLQCLMKAVVLLFILSIGVVAAAPIRTDPQPGTGMTWSNDSMSLTMRTENVSGECLLLVVPAQLDDSGKPQEYQIRLSDAIYVAQAAAENNTVVFSGVRPASWQDCAVILIGAEISDSPRMVGTIRPAEQQADREFSDVQKDDWYYNAVKYAADNGLISGMPDGSFRPEEEITGGEYLTVLYRYAAEQLKLLPRTETQGTEWLSGAELLNGTLSLHAQIFEPLTRYETARLTALVLQYAQEQAGIGLPDRQTHGFADVPEDSSYAPFCAFLESCGGIDGYRSGSDYVFLGDNTITRAEAAQILQNILSRIG